MVIFFPQHSALSEYLAEAAETWRILVAVVLLDLT